MNPRETLVRIVCGTPWLMEMLEAVRSVGPPNACVGAGVVRTAVWDRIHGYEDPSPVADVDVAYFAPEDPSAQSEAEYGRRLGTRRPGLVWDVVNQASVHLWYERAYGSAMAPLLSLEEGIACWPETATAVAVRLDALEQIQVIAPWGLSDLLDCVVRRSPRHGSAEQFRARTRAKRYAERWPKVQFVWD